MNSAIAQRYAKALFKLAVQEQQLDPTRTSLEGIQGLISSNPDLVEVCSNPLFSREEQWGVLERVLRKTETLPLVVQFMDLLVTKNRLIYLAAIVRQFGRLVDQSRGREEVSMRSSREMSEQGRLEMKTRLEEILGREIVLSVSHEPDLIAGATIQVGSQVFDGTIRGRLSDLRREMLRQT